jgi:hypothetical protein
MRLFRCFLVFGALTVLAGSASDVLAQTQSLADVAKKEEERRKSQPQPTKVYTNKDLTPVPGPPSAPAEGGAKDASGKEGKDGAAKDGAAKDAPAKDASAKDAKDSKAADGKDGGRRDSGGKDEKYWSDKLKALREQLDRDKTFADALQNKINSLTTDFINRDDPAQKRVIEQERQKAVAELARLNKAMVDDRKAIADLEEEARRAGVPPGWLR